MSWNDETQANGPKNNNATSASMFKENDAVW